MGVRRSLARLAGLSAAPVLILTACGDTSSSIADPPISSAPQSSDPTTKPAHESAKHFIQRWADEERDMENTGKTSGYLALTNHCQACSSLARDVRRYYAAGGFVHWKGLKVLAVRSTDDHQFTVRTDSQPTRYRVSANSPVQNLQGGVTSESVTLQAHGNSWRVTARARLAS